MTLNARNREWCLIHESVEEGKLLQREKKSVGATLTHPPKRNEQSSRKAFKYVVFQTVLWLSPPPPPPEAASVLAHVLKCPISALNRVCAKKSGGLLAYPLGWFQEWHHFWCPKRRTVGDRQLQAPSTHCYCINIFHAGLAAYTCFEQGGGVRCHRRLANNGIISLHWQLVRADTPAS